MKNATHKLVFPGGGIAFYFRCYRNGRTDMQHTKPGGETKTTRSPSLQSDMLRGFWRDAIRYCYGSAVADSLPVDLRLVSLATEAALAAIPENVKAMQRAINSGMAWRLQGSYGRAAMAALEAGDCMLPLSPERFRNPRAVQGLTEADCIKDAYGNVVPFRDMLKDGTKGTRGNVVARHGEAYADALDAIGSAFGVGDVMTLETEAA